MTSEPVVGAEGVVGAVGGAAEGAGEPAGEAAAEGAGELAADPAGEEVGQGAAEGAAEPAGDPAAEPTDADLATRAKALSVPLRWRILRLCLHEPRTNRQLADLLGVNPATMLHHVRTLANAGYLRALPARRGTRGAREIPYLATRLTWTQREKPATSDVVLRAFLDEVEGLGPDDLDIMRAGLLLSDAERDELQDRIFAVVRDYLGAEPGERTSESRTPWSLFTALHPDTQQG